MTEVPLLAGYTDETTQWRAETLQMINWGGFEGYHRVDFDRDSTLLSGASGTGKSTLLDAYTAIMMPAKVPFNGASNDLTQGRARSVDQRNVLTYLRGKRDSARDGDLMTDQVLRGDSEATWGVLSMTFVSDLMGRRFTVLRTYFAPASARDGAGVTSKMFTLDAAFDLRDLAQFADSRFDVRAIKAAFPGLTAYDGPGRFSDAITTRLGIGAAGNGQQALMLLARIQAGQQFPTVDRLYKELVLEEPTTIQAADDAGEHFRTLNAAYEALETEAKKERQLRDIADLHSKYERAQQRADQLDEFGVARDGTATPFNLWQLRTLAELLDAAEDQNRTARDQATKALHTANGEVGRLEAESSRVLEELQANGGGALERLEGQLKEASAWRDTVNEARVKLATRAEVLHLDLPNETAFNEVHVAARAFMATAANERDALQVERDGCVARRPGLVAQIKDLDEERASLQTRDGRIPMPFDLVRNEIARACGLRPADLPFAGELMDVAPEYEDWRLGAEMTLRSVGLTMLVDARRRGFVQRTIDPLHLTPRVTFQAVNLGEEASTPSDQSRISGRLIFKDDSPFVGWVKNRVQHSNSDHLCVDTPAELHGPGPRVTIHGQTANGSRGAHGRNRNEGFILGFSNEARLAEIASERAALKDDLDAVDATQRDLDSKLTLLGRRKEAYQAVLDAEWTRLDIDAAEAQIATLEAERQRLVANSDVLGELQRQRDTITQQLDAARETAFAAKRAVSDLQVAHEDIVDRHDATTAQLDQIDRESLIVLSGSDAAQLMSQFQASQGTDVTYLAFEDAAKRFRKILASEADVKQKAAEGHAKALQSIFESYNRSWPDPNRGDTVEFYQDFKAIYDALRRDSLYEQRESWKRELQTWSGNHLRTLQGAFSESLNEISERLEPVNEILRTLPFGAERERLRIDLRPLEPQAVTTFRQELRRLASNTSIDWTDDQAEERFRRLRAFMTQLDPKDGSTKTRDALLDVRKHVQITATRVGADGRDRSTYSALGGKSGGETQELIAFIVGAALRYRLGDETRTMPRFAPVFLDEAFIKADSQFSKRAVDAWRGLGFQLIIAAPLEKVTGLEPHMHLNLAVTKNLASGMSFVSPFRDAPTVRASA